MITLVVALNLTLFGPDVHFWSQMELGCMEAAMLFRHIYIQMVKVEHKQGGVGRPKC